ncbi:MAG: thiamine phosphate synthase [Anaerovoracaceae bacterium]|jgi:thiamine-phosphate pyrophosphorylase
MFRFICVTDIKLCSDFARTVEKLSASRAAAIILREKDLDEKAYCELAAGMPPGRLIIHDHPETARRLGIKKLHLSWKNFRELASRGQLDDFDLVGTSIHSVEDARLAAGLGADYLIFGHVFATACKQGLAPRGTAMLADVCRAVDIDVYAIGGISESTVAGLAKVGCANFRGACLMSSLMQADDPAGLLEAAEEIYMKEKLKQCLRLYAITDRRWLNGRSLKDDVAAALRGGAGMIQLREKDMPRPDFIREAGEIHDLCSACGVPLIINDDVEVAREIDAEGVHLGPDDMTPDEARKILGRAKIIGGTARTLEMALRAQALGADYLGSGAVFGSDTKSEATKMDRETLKEITASVDIPVVAIGGITSENVMQLQGTGIAGAAVISGIFAADDIEAAARSLLQSIRKITGEEEV